MSQEAEYRFKACGDQLYVEEKGTRFWTGSVEVASGKHRVRNSDGEIVAVVDKIGDAIPLLVAHYKTHPPPWKHEKPTEYEPEDPISGELFIGQEPVGFWSIYRMQSQILLRDGRPAAFRTADEAKRVAHVHAYDAVDKRGDDGFSWHEMDRT